MHSDARNKAVALGRIRRLASSGLPLEPFVRTIFELINDAVPNCPNRSLHVGTDRADAYICTSDEVNRILPLHNHYFVESEPEISGAKHRVDLHTMRHLLPTRTIWQQHEFFSPTLHRAEGFNEAYRPLGWDHVVGVIFHEAGKYAGYYGVWRTNDQKPFGREDFAFLEAAAPHITHGLQTASLIRDEETPEAGFAPLPGWECGAILMNQDCVPIAIDPRARLIFQQMAVLEGTGSDPLDFRSVRDAFEYVTRSLRRIFRDPNSGSVNLAPPAFFIYRQQTGLVLKFRGVQMFGSDGREYVTVLVERGETLDSRRRRLIARWGLSMREAEVLSLVAQGKTGPEIAVLLGISHDTSRKHLSRVFQKLGVENRTAAMSTALEAVGVVDFLAGTA